MILELERKILLFTLLSRATHKKCIWDFLLASIEQLPSFPLLMELFNIAPLTCPRPLPIGDCSLGLRELCQFVACVVRYTGKKAYQTLRVRYRVTSILTGKCLHSTLPKAWRRLSYPHSSPLSRNKSELPFAGIPHPWHCAFIPPSKPGSQYLL